jgi:cytochrome c biogenesis protein CcmG/thiol:disulfide interchange protein DsbE
MKAIYWRILPFVLFMLLALFLWRGLSLDPHQLPSAKIGKALPSFELKAIGDEGAVFTKAPMLGQISLLNVWASWCAACLDEQPFLLQLAGEGVAIYGLNYKDDINNAKKWLEEWGNPYKAVGGDFAGKVAIDLGVYGAPETFLVDKAGIIRYRHAGVLTPKIWQDEFVPLIKSLTRGKG